MNIEKRLKFEAIKAYSFNYFLNAALIFLSVNFILSFFGIPYGVSLVPAFIYFIKGVFSRFRKFDIADFEKEHEGIRSNIETLRKAVKQAPNMSKEVYTNLIRKVKSSFLFELIVNKNAEHKIYAIVALAIITILIGSFNLYPTKITFKVSDIDLTKPSLILDTVQRINIEKPEFTSCYDELAYTQGSLYNTTYQLEVTTADLESEQVLSEKKSGELVSAYTDIVECSRELNTTKPYMLRYENCDNELDETDAKYTSLNQEKGIWIAEKTTYIQENSELRRQLDRLRDDLAECNAK